MSGRVQFASPDLSSARPEQHPNEKRRRLAVPSISMLTLSVGLTLGTAGCGSNGAASLRVPFFSSKPTVTTVNPLLGAELVQLPSYPAGAIEESIPNAAPGIRCESRHVIESPDVPDTPVIEERLPERIANTALIVHVTDRRPLSILNLEARSGQFTYLWDLVSDSDLRPVGAGSKDFLPGQSKWTGSFIEDAVCLPERRILFAISYRDLTTKTSLFLHEIDTDQFKTISISPGAHTPYYSNVFFELRRPREDTSIVLYYSEPTNIRGDIFKNIYNHILLFSPRYPDGIELLKLGIDVGSIREWHTTGDTLYLHTRDDRDPENTPDGVWSLDLSAVLD